jgi:hypothetical protein
MVVPAANRKPCKVYSKLSLQGKWLSDLGFVPGDVVQIIIAENRMMIEKM